MRISSQRLLLSLFLGLFAHARSIPLHFFRQSRALQSSRPLVQHAIETRGGSRQNNDEDDEDDYDNVEEEDDRPPPKRRTVPPPSSSQRGPRQPPHLNRRRGPPPQPRRRGPPPPPRRPSTLTTASILAKKTADVTKAAAWTTLKGSGKAAFYLVSPKHVSRGEVYGVWRLDQSTTVDGVVCAANVEFTPRGDVVVKYENQTFVTPFLFRERRWPQSCTIEFEARAFQGPRDAAPVRMKYRGCFRRKLADGSVIKIVGHFYIVKKKGIFGGGEGKKIGTFVARRRLTKQQHQVRRAAVDPVMDDDYDDDYDDEEVDKQSDNKEGEGEEVDEYNSDEYDEDDDGEL